MILGGAIILTTLGILNANTAPLLGDAEAQAGALQDLEEHGRGLPEAEQEQLAKLYRLAKRRT
jgi:hypothetical protein